MANVSTLNAKTFANAQTDSANLVGEVFDRAIQLIANTKDCFSHLEGPEGSMKPICTKTDLSKGQGQTVHFTVFGSAGHSAKRGESTLQGNEEKIRAGSYSAKVDIVRHAIAWTHKMEAFLSAGKSVDQTYALLLGEWWGRTKEQDMKMKLRSSATTSNIVRPNNRASRNALLSADTISTSTIQSSMQVLSMLGARPASLGKSRAGADILRYLFFGTLNVLNPLKNSSSYQNAVRDAGVRGDGNVLFQGGFVDWDGQSIYHQNVHDADTDGPIGDPFEPRAQLGTAITAGTSTFAIAGGGLAGPQTGADYFRWFPGYPYAFYENETISADTDTHYVVVYNLTGSDAGKFGVYSYVGSDNDGQEITITNRLGAGTGGAEVSTLAGQTFDSAVHTENHPAGSLIFPVNSKCVPIGWSVHFGAAGGLRATGAEPMHGIESTEDYGMQRGRGVQGIYGTEVSKDTAGQPRNYVLVESAISIPGVTMPTVTA